jgi:hypothetical protein
MLSVTNENDQKVLWHIVLANGLSYDDYNMHRNCALVDKNFHQTIEKTYRPYKKRIEDVMQRKSISITGHTSWNKDFSKCAWVTFSDQVVPGGKNLQLTLVGVTDENRVISSSRLWQGFNFSVFEDNIRPFFDEDGRACFYGLGKTANFYKNEVSFIEYLIALDGKAECYDCHLVIVAPYLEGHGNAVYSGTCLLNFPALLKAWLQSKITSLIKICNATTWKTYNINGATLLEYCKTYQKHVGTEKFNKALVGCYPQLKPNGFLPKDFEWYLDERYEQQQHEKIMEMKKNDERNNIS